MWSKPKTERNAKILELKKEGKTNSYIGKLFGISPQMVSQVCVTAAKNKLHKLQPNTFRSTLSDRLINGLAEYFGGSLPGPVVIANEGATRLSMANGVGPKRYRWLQRRYINMGI